MICGTNYANLSLVSSHLARSSSRVLQLKRELTTRDLLQPKSDTLHREAGRKGEKKETDSPIQKRLLPLHASAAVTNKQHRPRLSPICVFFTDALCSCIYIGLNTQPTQPQCSQISHALVFRSLLSSLPSHRHLLAFCISHFALPTPAFTDQSIH